MECCFPMWKWIAQLFLELAERRLKSVPNQRRLSLETWANSWITTKVNEDAIRHCKMKMRQSDSGQLSRLSRWKVLSESLLLADYGREGVTSALEDAAFFGGDPLEQDLFKADFDHYTLHPEEFDSIMKKKDQNAYPQLSLERFHSCGLRWESYVRCSSWEELKSHWKTQLLSPGWLLTKNPADGGPRVVIGIVLEVIAYYVVLCKVKVLSLEKKLFVLDKSCKPCWEMIQLKELSGYSLSSVVSVAPYKVQSLDCGYRMAITVKGGARPIVKVLPSWFSQTQEKETNFHFSSDMSMLPLT